MYTLKVLLPHKPNEDEVIFRGYVSRQGTVLSVLFTDMDTVQIDTDMIYGIFIKGTTRKFEINEPNRIIMTNTKKGFPEVVNFIIDHKCVPLENTIIMFYDQASFKNTEALDVKLWENITMHKLDIKETLKPDQIETTNIKSKWIGMFMFIQHVANYFHLFKWFCSSGRNYKRISVQHGNFLLVLIADILVGYLILEYLTPDKNTIRAVLVGTLEILLESMYSLLKWLMGAPAGLKLNNAFNKMLGRYFSYHVHLWWLFIDISGEKLDMILSAYYYISYFGVTFQAALVSDMICIVTFHSYCIYVYAARLFNMQISGLTALLRLFVGRKYNPLRNAIDSCEYTNQELFVGTVAFTILLLLLPTTTMYYIVFTVFRLLSLIVQYILAKVIYCIQSLPLYVMILKLINSPKVAGNIHIEVLHCEENGVLVLQVKLLSKSLEDLVGKFKPPIKMLNRMEWSGICAKVLTGKPLT